MPAHAKALARAKGLGQLRLLTNAAFTKNLALYEKIGFQLDHAEPFHLGGTTVYLGKALM
ncbi:MAG: hypothetical protein MO846_06185 [Candidatus Devosia symbiotica]|nr:hypothetical protein [Candidatus Devosia symbiotica]